MVAGVAYLSLMASPPQPITFAFADKLEHAAGFAWLALWFFQIVSRSRSFALAGVLLLLGVAIEVAQSFTVTRTSELADLAADGAGILLGALLARTRLGGLLAVIERRLASKDLDT
jgi:VanZ family protein